MKAPAGKIVLKCRKVIGGIAEGEALVSKMPLMGWGNVDSQHGYTTERNHPLYEVPYKGKVLVFTEPRGSGGFGYDPLFYCPALGLTFGEAGADRKFSLSHRGQALRAMLAAL